MSKEPCLSTQPTSSSAASASPQPPRGDAPTRHEHVAVVVDDHDMGVTHVIRGDDHLNNAARQMLVYDAMGWDVPVWAHIPLIHGEDGKKLSKKEREAGREFVTKAEDQLDAYLNPLFAEKAVTIAEVDEEGGVLRLESKNVMTTGDTVVIEFAPGWGPATRADIKTTVEGSPVELEVLFDGVEHGPRYPVRSTTATTWQGILMFP